MHSQQPPGVVQNWSTLQCSKQNTEQCGYDHAPVTRGRMRAQFPLPHGPANSHPLQSPPPPPGETVTSMFFYLTCIVLVCVAHLLYTWPCIAFPLLQIKHLCVFCDILSPKAFYGCVASCQTDWSCLDWSGCASGR